MSLCMNQLLVAVISFLFVTSALFYDTVLGITNCSISFLSCLCKFKIDYSMLDLLPTCHHFSYQLLWDLELVAGHVAICGEGGGWLRIACTTLSCLNFMVYGAPRAGLWNDWNLWNHIFRVPRKRTARQFGSTGSLVSGVEVKIVDIETLKCLPPNELGEICVRGPNIMQGKILIIDCIKKTRPVRRKTSPTVLY